MKGSKITPELIPHSEFHTGIWLLSPNRPDWYYFLKKRNHNSIRDKRFLSSVDRPLRKLVRFLHTRGIKTTPSCSGHHIRERSLEKIYDALEKDSQEIRSIGLNLKDVETGQIYFYNDKKYQLPWSREEFVEKVSVYQQKGVIGLRPGKRKKVKKQLLKLQIDGATFRERDGVIFIFTNEDNKGDNRKTWKQITRAVMKVVDRSVPVKARPVAVDA